MSLLRTTGRLTLWGLGIYIGMRVASEIAKPLTKEVSRGYTKMRDRIKKAATRTGGAETAEKSVKSGATKIPVVEIVPGAAAGAAASTTVKKAAPRKQRRITARKSSKPSASWSRAALYARARELDISGRSNMTKKDLLAAVKAAS